jgi:alanine racemase
MDQVMISIGKDGTAYNGDEAVLLGEQDGERITVEELAEWAGTIPHDIFAGINTRVPRVYVSR